MDHLTQAQSSIHGSYGGNNGSNNNFGSYNTTTNIYGPCGATDFGVGNGKNGFGAGDEAPRPSRLIPYARNNKFVGRRDSLESVERFSGRGGHNRIALHGLGGSGKTQIALEYVHQRASQSNCDIFWVHGSGPLKFNEGFRAIAQHVRIPPPGSETDEEASLLAIRRWFEGASSGDWILVIDNADNEADFEANNSPIAKFIPQGTKGTLIFTTRSRQVASRQGCEMIEVGKMGKEEAGELFSKRFGNCSNFSDEDKKAIGMILDSVHHLPLAIIGSAAFMIETQTPPSDYWTIFRENEARMKELLSDQFCDVQREVDVTESILGTHFVTFDRIRLQMPSAADLLWLMAFFDRQNIPQELLTQSGLEGMNDSVKFRRAIGKLLGFSLVTSVKCENKTFYELHRLVQLSLQVYLSTEDLNQRKDAALRVVSRLFPQDWEAWRDLGPEYIPHALAVARDSTDPIAEELGFHVGRYFQYMCSYNNAEIQFRRCIALREEGTGYDWDDEGYKRFMLLGLVNAHQGKYDESGTMSRRALEERRKVVGPDHPDTLECVSNLAKVLRVQGKYKESESMNRLALEGCKKLLGPDHPDTLSSVNDLTRVLAAQGKYEESETMGRRALEGRKKALGPDDPHTLTSIYNLSKVLRYQGKFHESEEMQRHELERCEKVFGPDHPNTLTSISNLASVLRDQGKCDESDEMNRRALQGYEKVLGPDHPYTLTSVSDLALVLQDQGKYDASEGMNCHALEGYEKVLGPDHPHTLTSVSNLASVLRDQGKYDESEKMNRRALGGRETVLGPDHPDTLMSFDNLALVLRDQGKYDELDMMNGRARKRLRRNSDSTDLNL